MYGSGLLRASYSRTRMLSFLLPDDNATTRVSRMRRRNLSLRPKPGRPISFYTYPSSAWLISDLRSARCSRVIWGCIMRRCCVFSLDLTEHTHTKSHYRTLPCKLQTTNYRPGHSDHHAPPCRVQSAGNLTLRRMARSGDGTPDSTYSADASTDTSPSTFLLGCGVRLRMRPNGGK